ncbi:MAG: IS200/IS605 family transposase [Myxococcota bacterium]
MLRQYTHSNHTVYHHRYHLVWITKYRYKVLRGEVAHRARDVIAQVCEECDVKIINGVVSKDHIHLFVSIPPHVLVSDFVKRVKGRSSRKLQQEFPHLRKRYWGRHFWGRGYFSSTSGNVTDDVIDAYIDHHTEGHRSDGTENISLES